MILEILFLGSVACAVFFALCALRALVIRQFVRDHCEVIEDETDPL